VESTVPGVYRGSPENQLQHEVFTVEGEESPEEAQGHHAQLQDTITTLLTMTTVTVE